MYCDYTFKSNLLEIIFPILEVNEVKQNLTNFVYIHIVYVRSICYSHELIEIKRSLSAVVINFKEYYNLSSSVTGNFLLCPTGVNKYHPVTNLNAITGNCLTRR